MKKENREACLRFLKTTKKKKIIEIPQCNTWTLYPDSTKVTVNPPPSFFGTVEEVWILNILDEIR